MMDNLDFKYRDEAEEFFEYYLLGRRPIRLTLFNGEPKLAETVDIESKKLIIDNLYITKILNALDAVTISKNDFINHCLSFGIKLKHQTDRPLTG